MVGGGNLGKDMEPADDAVDELIRDPVLLAVVRKLAPE